METSNKEFKKKKTAERKIKVLFAFLCSVLIEVINCDSGREFGFTFRGGKKALTMLEETVFMLVSKGDFDIERRGHVSSVSG